MHKLKAILCEIKGRIKRMPIFTTNKWNGFIVKVTTPERDLIRSIDIFHLLPYFWDTEISLDLLIQPPKSKLKIEEDWEYRWELCDLDDEIIKQNKGSININPKEVKKNYWARKERAILLGRLKPNQQYILKLYLSSGEYGRSDSLQVAAYTVKDRDEYNIQLLILIFGIGFAFILWVLSRGQ